MIHRKNQCFLRNFDLWGWGPCPGRWLDDISYINPRDRYIISVAILEFNSVYRSVILHLLCEISPNLTLVKMHKFYNNIPYIFRGWLTKPECYMINIHIVKQSLKFGVLSLMAWFTSPTLDSINLCEISIWIR